MSELYDNAESHDAKPSALLNLVEQNLFEYYGLGPG